MTQAEIDGLRAMARRMNLKDLKWQVANAGLCNMPEDATQLFRDELKKREVEK